MTPTHEANSKEYRVSCVVIREIGEVNQCIMYPTDSTEEEIKERYVLAEGSGFVSLEKTQ